MGGTFALLPALAGSALLGVGAAALYGAAYRFGVRKAAQQLEQQLSDLEAGVKGRSLLGTSAPIARPRQAGRGDDSVVIIA